jgi:hypothetical protein
MDKPSDEIRGGSGINVSRFGKNVVLSANRHKEAFIPAFPVQFGGKFVSVGYGTVNGIEPTIMGVKISDPMNQPRIAIGDDDSEGRSWVYVKVQIDLGTMQISKKPDSVTIVTEKTDTDLVGYHPIAIISSGIIHQITYFNLQHALGYPPINGLGKVSGVPRHFFW